MQFVDVISIGGRVEDWIWEKVAERLDVLRGFEANTNVNNIPNPGTYRRVSVNALAKNGGLHIEMPH